MNKPSTNQVIGRNLTELRERYDISTRVLAAGIGVSVAQIYKYESGVNNIPFPKVIKIAKFLGISIMEALGALTNGL